MLGEVRDLSKSLNKTKRTIELWGEVEPTGGAVSRLEYRDRKQEDQEVGSVCQKSL